MSYCSLTDEDHRRILALLAQIDYQASFMTPVSCFKTYKHLDSIKRVMTEARDRQFRQDLASLGVEPFRLRG